MKYRTFRLIEIDNDPIIIDEMPSMKFAVDSNATFIQRDGQDVEIDELEIERIYVIAHVNMDDVLLLINSDFLYRRFKSIYNAIADEVERRAMNEIKSVSDERWTYKEVIE